VVVLGSANADLVYRVERIPSPGETVLATEQARHMGGKGLNQAVAAARAGAATLFVGAVGDDPAGDELTSALADAGVATDVLRRAPGPSGTALITVQADGENTIVVASGANASLTGLTDSEATAIESASVLVMQLDCTVVLNAAPARSLDDSLLGLVDVLVVNEHEAALLAANPDADASAAARVLRGRCTAVVVTLGGAGALVVDDSGETTVPAPAAQVVDTTGAGDTFTGYLAAGLAAGLDLTSAARRAVVAGSISVERAGAVPSIPTADEVDERIR
jgi:ribokinase